MEKFDQWYLPDGEAHLPGWMIQRNCRVEGRLTYQYHKYVEALKLCLQRRTAVDVGAHVGLFSYWLVRDFALVQAFEPVEKHRECFEKNIDKGNVQLHACALGEKNGMISIHTAPTSSGDSWVNGSGDIPMKRLDDFHLTDVDFLKIDTEGHELFVLRGGEDTLKRCRPAILVEQKPGHAKKYGIGERDAVPYLQSLGAKLRSEISGDFLLSWD